MIRNEQRLPGNNDPVFLLNTELRTVTHHELA